MQHNVLLGHLRRDGVCRHPVHPRGRRSDGSEPGDVVELMIRRRMRFSLVAVAVGLAGTLATAHLIKSLLWVETTDSLTAVIAPPLLTGEAFQPPLPHPVAGRARPDGLGNGALPAQLAVANWHHFQSVRFEVGPVEGTLSAIHARILADQAALPALT